MEDWSVELGKEGLVVELGMGDSGLLDMMDSKFQADVMDMMAGVSLRDAFVNLLRAWSYS